MKLLSSNKHTAALIAVLGANIIWGTSGFAIKLAIEEVSNGTYILLRFALVSLLLLPWAIKFFPSKLSFKEWSILLVTGIIAGPLNFILIVNGLSHTNLSAASFILLAEPVVIFLLAGRLLHERLSRTAIAGLGVALLGALLTAFGTAGVDVGGVSLVGNMLILSVIVLSALSLVLTKRVIGEVSPRFLLWLLSFLSAAAAVFMVDFSTVSAEVSTISFVAASGILWGVLASTVLAYYCYFFAVRILKAGEIGIFRYSDPLIGATIGFLLLGEAFSPIYMLGGAIILTGIVIVESHPGKVSWYQKLLHRARYKHMRHHHLLHRM